MVGGRILYDVTKACKQRQKSGIARVSSCLKRELKDVAGSRFTEVVWDDRIQSLRILANKEICRAESGDVFLTCELFCEFEREGIEEYISSFPGFTYAIFHDAIPLQHPEFTWPHSVQRHPSYMKMLARFSGVFAVSSHSAMQLEEYWEWLEMRQAPSVRSIQLGCDGVFEGSSPPKSENSDPLTVLTLAIVEKRKGQDIALDAAKALWEEGHRFEYHFVGRTNPYFGKELERMLKRAAREGYPVTPHGQLNDESLKRLFESADLVVLPSLAEGCGLPVLEALWKGVPTLSSSLHSIRENARFGGCRLFQTGDRADLTDQLRLLLGDRSELRQLTSSIRTEALPRWNSTVRDIIDHMVTDGA